MEEARRSVEESLVDLFRNADSALPMRPAFKSGLKGRKVQVTANFFRMQRKGMEGDSVYRYEITFTYSSAQLGIRNLPKRLTQNALATFIRTTGRGLFKPIGEGYGYDNVRILFTSIPLQNIPEEGQTFSFQFTEFEGSEPKMMDINIKPNGSVHLVPDLNLNIREDQDFLQNPSVLQALDIICKKDAFQNHIVFGSRIFVSEQLRRRIRIAAAHDLVFGHHQSTRLCQGGVMMNIDRSTAVLYRGGPLIKAMANVLGKDIERSNYQLSESDHRILNELTRLRVEISYRPYKSRLAIRSFTRSRCDQTFFSDDGVDVSVFDYFLRHYPNINLRYPHLPCIVYGNGKYIPVELCTLLPDQRKQQKLRDDLLRVASSFTTSQKPQQRAIEIVEEARRVAGQNSLKPFNISLIPEMVTVGARVLDPPSLEYGQGPYTPRNGDWNMYPDPKNRQDKQKKLLRPVQITRWALLIMSEKVDKRLAIEFVGRLKAIGQSLGVPIANPLNPFKQLEPTDWKNTLEVCTTKGLQLIVIIMPKSDLYNDIKFYCDKNHGIVTQVVDDRHSEGKNGPKFLTAAYLMNLLLKVNIKLGGVNTKLTEGSKSPCPLLNDKTMVVGIDVNHPGSGENVPSIASVVGSIDKDFVKYRTEMHVNPERQELVPVAQLMRPIIEAYHTAQGFYPKNILVYRDGVGEGYFRRVMDEEIDPLRLLLEEYNNPTLTYIIVSKRHNTRFFPTDEKNKTRSGNILPGTVIDTEICHYKLFDFYLCSQNSLLGTARPGKYTVLWNSSGASADILQLSTYFLCYLFARATKSISDPAPARYAHHACTRGKLYLGQMLPNDEAPDYEALIAQLNARINVENDLRNIPYYV